MVRFHVSTLRHMAKSCDCSWIRTCQLEHRLVSSKLTVEPPEPAKMPRTKHITQVRKKKLKWHERQRCRALKVSSANPSLWFAPAPDASSRVNEASIPCCWPCKDPQWDADENVGMSWWHPPRPNSEVCCLITSYISHIISFTGLQTGPHVSFPPITKVCLALKLLGPTKSIMAIEHFLLIWWHSWRRLSQYNIVIINLLIVCT